MSSATNLRSGEQSKTKPNVVFMASVFGVRSEVWMYRHATLMQNCHVTVICREHWNSELYPETSGCSIDPIPTGVSRSLAVKCFGKNIGTRTVTAVMNRLRNAAFDFYPGTYGEREWIRARLASLQPQTVLLQYGTAAVAYAGLLGRLGHRYAIHFHGHDLSQAVRDPRYARKLVAAASGASALIVVAEYMRDWLVEQGIEAQKVHRIPYGVPIDSFKPLDAVAKTEHESVELLMVGRLTEKKAPELTLRAFAKCRESCSRAFLRIIGDGDLLSQCRALADELQVNEHVEFMGSQPTEVVRQAMQQADLFVQHSVTSPKGDKEGWPVAIAEAAGSGLPVISTKHASIPEQVVHGQTGLLCDELDWQTMSEHMRQLVSDADLRRKMGDSARRHISKWDTKTQVQALERHLLTDRLR